MRYGGGLQVGGKTIGVHPKIWGRVSVQEPHRSPFVLCLLSFLCLNHILYITRCCFVPFLRFVVLYSRNRLQALSTHPNNSSNNRSAT
jgi:hypothetical protein